MDVTKKKVLPKGALVIVLHTCEFPEGNTYAKRVTKEAIRVLGAQDEAGVLAFTQGGSSWVFELTPVSQYDAMVRKINAAQPGDMLAFEPIMKAGFDALSKSDAAAKHMIIISDGDPAPPSPQLLKGFHDREITISTVSIFPHGGMEVDTLRAMANVTGGRYYNTNDPEQLPSIFIKEAKSLKRAMVQIKTFTPEIGFPSPILKGLGGLPPLHGYVLTTPKERLTELILEAHTTEDDQLDPVLSRWKFGLGTTAAFTSDLSTNWGADWVGWENYRPFVKQLMLDISRVQEEEHLRMWCYTSGTQGVIVAEDFHPQNMFLEMQARISGPQDRSETVQLRQIAPRRYQATVPLVGPRPLPGDGDRQIGGPHGPRSRGIHRPVFARVPAVPVQSDRARRRSRTRRGARSSRKTRRSTTSTARTASPSRARGRFSTGSWSRWPACCRSTWLSGGFRSTAIRSPPSSDWADARGNRRRRWGHVAPRKKSVEKALDAQRLPFPIPSRPETERVRTPCAGRGRVAQGTSADKSGRRPKAGGTGRHDNVSTIGTETQTPARGETVTTNMSDQPSRHRKFEVLQEEADDFAAIFNAARAEIGQVIVGQDRVVEATLTAIFCGGNVLLGRRSRAWARRSW